MEDGGQKSQRRGARWGCERDKEGGGHEAARMFSLSLSPLTPPLSLSSVESSLSLISHLSSLISLRVPVCVFRNRLFCLCREREREKGGHTTAVEYDGGEGQSTANKCLVG